MVDLSSQEVFISDNTVLTLADNYQTAAAAHLFDKVNSASCCAASKKLNARLRSVRKI